MDEKILVDIKEKLVSELNFKLEKSVEIHKGLSNKLFKLTSDKGEKLLLKIYYSKNDQHLYREFHALTFLNSKSFKNIPKAYFKNDELNYAIYSFENGEERKVSDLIKENIDQMTSFLASVHNLNDEELYTEFSDSIMKRRSLQDHIHNTVLRINSFNEYAHSKEAHPKVIKLASEFDFPKLIDELIKKTVSHLSEEEINQPLELHQFRLSPLDFGIHNMLWKTDGSTVFLDFEYFGLDDPIRVVSEFIVHDQSYAISDTLKRYFLSQYKTKVNLPKNEFERINILIKLFFIDWISFFLNSISPKGFEQRQFSNSHFDLDKYIDDQIIKIKQRMNDISKYESNYL